MHFHASTLFFIPLLVIAKPCDLEIKVPQNCDRDQWHQEVKLKLRPGSSLNIGCYTRGRTLAGSNKWYWEVDRECWVPDMAIGVGCDCKCRESAFEKGLMRV
jgi:hypothetical protein